MVTGVLKETEMPTYYVIIAIKHFMKWHLVSFARLLRPLSLCQKFPAMKIIFSMMESWRMFYMPAQVHAMKQCDIVLQGSHL
jgi:hypothetical protein